ncbi:hypothetical protein Cantr_09977 [Candida viswanathii]|uniref:Uncharacterized protein n=1 Tax=Candida viswanathii TaxID=5486 RepID=A0A367YC55_9ASCO|nr:hypothetical protein Cantr_09977 [Candida viswanathii]
MGSAASKQGRRKLTKVVSDTAATSINRTPNVKQLPPQTLKEKFEHHQEQQALGKQQQQQQQPDQTPPPTFRPSSTTDFDPKFLKKKLKSDENSHAIPEGKDGGDPHEQGTSTYDNSFLSSVNKLGSQIKTVELNPARDKNAVALKQLRSRKKLYDLGEQQVKNRMEQHDLEKSAENTMVHPQTLSAILRDLKDDRVTTERVVEDYQLHPGFLKKLGTNIRLPATTVVLEEDVDEDQVGHTKVPPQHRRDISEMQDGDENMDKQEFTKLKKRISLDD